MKDFAETAISCAWVAGTSLKLRTVKSEVGKGDVLVVHKDSRFAPTVLPNRIAKHVAHDCLVSSVGDETVGFVTTEELSYIITTYVGDTPIAGEHGESLTVTHNDGGGKLRSRT